MDLPTLVLVLMFGFPVVAILAIYLLARNWTTPVEHPEEDRPTEE